MLHGFSGAQAALRNPGSLARAHILITEHWRVQGDTRPLLRMMMTGLTFPPGPFLGRLLNVWPHPALALLTAQLFNTAVGGGGVCASPDAPSEQNFSLHNQPSPSSSHLRI